MKLRYLYKIGDELKTSASWVGSHQEGRSIVSYRNFYPIIVEGTYFLTSEVCPI